MACPLPLRHVPPSPRDPLLLSFAAIRSQFPLTDEDEPRSRFRFDSPVGFQQIHRTLLSLKLTGEQDDRGIIFYANCRPDLTSPRCYILCRAR